MIRYSNNFYDKEIAKKLWKKSFRDSDEYIEYYFENRYNNNFLLYENDEKEILGGMHCNSYTIDFFSNENKSKYIVGVATLPEKRGKGVFKDLMNYSLKKFRKEGINYLFLKPANSLIYEKYEFAYSHYVEKYEINFEEILEFKDYNIIEEIKKSNILEYKEYFNKKMQSYNSFIKKNDLDIFNNIDEALLENGGVYAVYNKNSQISGIFTYTTSEDDVCVKDFLFDNYETLSSIFSFLKSFKDYYKNIILTTPLNSEIESYFIERRKIKKYLSPMMMIRILDAHKTLKEYFEAILPLLVEEMFPEKEFSFFIALTDEHITENNMNFGCKIHDKHFFIDDGISSLKYDNGIFIKISDLTELIFGVTSLESLIKRKKIKFRVDENLSIFKKIFAQKIGYINEDV